MLRHQDKIRLTSQEKESLDKLAGYRQTAPKTVDEFNQRLDSAAEIWDAGDTAEEKLAAALARDLRLTPSEAVPSSLAPTGSGAADSRSEQNSPQPSRPDARAGRR